MERVTICALLGTRGEIGILAGGPPAGASPADAFLPKDTADLAARHLDALLLGDGGERVKRPLRVALRVGRGHRAS